MSRICKLQWQCAFVPAALSAPTCRSTLCSIANEELIQLASAVIASPPMTLVGDAPQATEAKMRSSMPLLILPRSAFEIQLRQYLLIVVFCDKRFEEGGAPTGIRRLALLCAFVCRRLPLDVLRTTSCATIATIVWNSSIIRMASSAVTQ